MPSDGWRRTGGEHARAHPYKPIVGGPQLLRSRAVRGRVDVHHAPRAARDGFLTRTFEPARAAGTSSDHDGVEAGIGGPRSFPVHTIAGHPHDRTVAGPRQRGPRRRSPMGSRYRIPLGPSNGRATSPSMTMPFAGTVELPHAGSSPSAMTFAGTPTVSASIVATTASRVTSMMLTIDPSSTTQDRSPTLSVDPRC